MIRYICEEKEGIQRVSITIPAADLSASFLPSFRFSTATQQRQQKTLKIDPRPPFCDSYLKELPISELNRERHVIISDGHQNLFHSLFFFFPRAINVATNSNQTPFLLYYSILFSLYKNRLGIIEWRVPDYHSRESD